MEIDHPEPVVRNWVTGFFLALLSISIPILSVVNDRVKLPYKGLQPQEHVRAKTTTKRSVPIMDASNSLWLPS